MASERQAANAIRFYDSRSYSYDDTWHADFTKRFASYVPVQPGQNVLDLACGTGLLSFLEADAVGPSGHVTGVDVTPSMLAVANFKKRGESEKYEHLDFIEGDVLHLDEMEALQGKTFDVITVASALVLFPDPKAAIEHWTGFLKPGGVVALDSTHPRNLVSGMVMERTARRLGLPAPFNREWSQSEASLKEVLGSAGVKVETVVTVENQAGYGRRFHTVETWDDHFVENVLVKDVARNFASTDVRRKAQPIFREEWERLAIDGKVEEVDSVFLAVARKPADGSRYIPTSEDNGIAFKGGCRCGSISYTSTAPPSDMTLCHCRACQHLSGSAFLPFIEVPTSALQFTSSMTLKTLHLSDFAERTFCTSCGSPITMTFKSAPEEVSIVWGSVDAGNSKMAEPKVWRHIYLKEKMAWMALPDDGAERWEVFPGESQ